MCKTDMDYQKLLDTTEQILILRGSSGSGNYGHDGRPGKKGGSSKGGGLRRIGVKRDTPSEDRKKAAKEFKAKRRGNAVKGKGGFPSDNTPTVDKEAKDWFLSNRRPSFGHPFTSLGGYMIDDTRSVSGKTIKKVSKDSGLSEKKVTEFIRDWGKSPNETGKVDHQRLQQSALKKFGIQQSAHQKISHNATDQSGKMLDSVYKSTQQEFKEKGIKSVTLYRGMSEAKSGNYDGNALDSWTIDPKVAQRFSNVSKGENKGVIKMVVPAERIVSTAFSGFGTLGDFEFVVLGGKNAGEAQLVDMDQPIIKSDIVNLTEQILTLRGGRGSGNWGHAGRKGKRGGSGKGGGLRAIGVKPDSSHKERRQASKKAKQTRQVKEKLLKDRALEDFSRDELLTLRSRIDQMLGGSQEVNNRLASEKPGTTHGHTTTVLGTDPSKKFDMRYEVRELDDLIVSNNDSGSINPNYPKELQPRDRSRVASQRQVDNIASNLQPDAMLGEFKAIDRGTPIIGDDNAVESGNGRSMALRRARDQHPEQFAKYQNELKKTAQEKGIDPATLDNFDNPVLVRRRLTDVDRVEFAKEANTASILGTSDTERARSDASRISSEHLQNIATKDSIDDTVRAVSNRDFVRSFVANTPEVERAEMIDRNGNLTRSGENRIKGAMFNRVYDSPELSDRIFESTDNDIKNVTNGIMNSLGPMSRAEELVRTGQRGNDLSIAPDISKTVQVYSSLKDRGLTVNDFLSQGALFGRELNSTQEKILVEIDNRRRSGKKMSEFMGKWSELVEREPHPAQGGLFGGTGGRSKDELVTAWIKEANIPTAQIGLFQ